MAPVAFGLDDDRVHGCPRSQLHSLTTQNGSAPEHASPQPPQLAALLEVCISQPSALVALQSAKPAWHASPQWPPLQNAVALAVPHVVLQPPQLSGSVPVLVQVPLQSTRGDAQVVPQAPFEHTCPGSQAFPHEPQFELSVCALAQYGAPPSGVHVVNEPHVSVHCPLPHICPGPHVLPQEPQLALSVKVLAQYEAPPSGVHVVNEPHVRLHSPPAHTVPAPQVSPQEPQLALSVRL
jgi:hypothetical protein